MGYNHSDRRKVKVGTALNVAGGGAMALSKAFQFVLRRMFGGEAFGLYMIAYSIMELLSNFVLGGFGDATTYHLAKYVHPTADESAEQKHSREQKLYATLATSLRGSLLIALALAGVLWGAAEFIYHTFWHSHNAEIVVLLRIIIWALPLLTLVYMLAESTRAHLDMRSPVLVVQTLFPLLSIVYALLLHFGADWGIFSMAWGSIAALLTCVPVAIYEFRRYYSLRRTLRAIFSTAGNRKVWHFAIPQSLNMASNAGLVKLDALILSFFVSANTVGIYALLVDLAQLIRLPKMAFSGIFGPLVARYQSQNNKSGIQESLRDLALLSALAGSAVLLLVQIFFPDFILGRNQLWTESAWIPWLVCVGPFMSVHFGLAGNLLLMSGHARLLLMNSLLALAVNVLLDLWWIPQWGILGAACAGAVANFSISTLQIIEMNKLPRISFGKALHWKGWVGLALSAILILTARTWSWEWRILLLGGTWLLLLSVIVFLPGAPLHPLRLWWQEILSKKQQIP